jgi:hypothetical protein
MVFYNRFYWGAKIDKARFRLFALRDRLAILAMKGEVEFKSEEYDLMMRLLNKSIKTLGTFSVVSFVRSMTSNHRDQERESKIMREVSLKKHDHEEFREVAVEYYKVIGETYNMFLSVPSKMFRLMFLLLWPLWIILRLINFIVNTITRKEKNLHEVDSYLKEMNDMMSA